MKEYSQMSTKESTGVKSLGVLPKISETEFLQLVFGSDRQIN